jgi:hypothetical protein
MPNWEVSERGGQDVKVIIEVPEDDSVSIIGRKGGSKEDR